MAIAYAPKSGLDTLKLSIPATALLLVGTAVLALLLYYFVGIDQGAVSVFGADTHVHEFVHDSRHFLGFPCH
ncbi:CbtB domain-containing protein [Skermania piniformis]|uniref:CbtB-domain containing protein n=1 Tax=Skermania pinensis TaxID=39122 RepID=A0ABX8S4F6_9ACTN|nr:CbtB domain-containing protein [Skermania piniformis]QXQ12628.1 CbtB-domain containing protein [Skermania piniformis]